LIHTNEPGFRGPVYPDGRFEYVPVPQSEPADGAPTYGDEHGVKAGPLSELSAGDYALFYATLSVADGCEDATPRDTPWLPPEWGAFLIGQFRLAQDPVTGEEYRRLPATEREPFANNAHVRRDPVDARVLLLGDPDRSRLYERAVPLSRPNGGVEAGALVTRLLADSGCGPWWRRRID
jgi:hypothetical protein